ncbi:low-density lipoprotein receptor-related protein 8-like isoform X1 [Danio aesculapii]|uniref:low-density lipoprotein receptor-related protein 8-like isoform X1 n=1 Tax=Danio aesculapii TaxID=1142201 RepID=UPI0024C04CF7|nr:low-density lipoprotein receptor-related protein 8-like isoform X1 [Danio aesculapii]
MEHLGAFLLLWTGVSCLPLTKGFPKCSVGQFMCANSRYVSLSVRCDAVNDCGDGSDESSCWNCTNGSFHCVASESCVSSSSVCDGRLDCADGADEQLDICTSVSKAQACARSEFTCTNGQCVPNSWRCDHSSDCKDGSDEEDCDHNECAVNNGGCSHICLDLPFGFRCDCPKGMRLVQDTHCEVVDQCLDADVCDQICVHSNGSVVCDCQDGYLLTAGTGQCKATGGLAHVAVSTQEGIKMMDLSGSEERNITDKRVSPGPVSALNAHNTLYWSSPENDVIYRMSLDSSDHTPAVLLKASKGIVGLAVDWIHERLYWISTSTHALHMASLNNTKQRLLISELYRPTAVAVQPLLGYVFWAESGESARIERVGLDGESRLALIVSFIRNPVAISLDVPRRLLYWADSGLRSISRISFDGQYRKTVVESNGYLDQPFGLAIFESRVYWSDQLTNSICSADKHNGTMLRVSQRLGFASPAGLVILHPLLQPADKVLLPSETKTSSNKDLLPSETKTALPDSQFTLMLTMIAVVLSVLLFGLVLWWQRSEFCAHRSVSLLGDVTLKESQDPLLLSSLPGVHEHQTLSSNSTQ